MQATEAAIRQVVSEVLSQLGRNPYVATSGRSRDGACGIFKTVDQAVEAATEGFRQLSDRGLEDRRKAINCVRKITEQQAEELGRAELEETKIGRLDHKIEKLQIVKLVPGVEFMKTDCVSGDNGLTLTEYAPFGVIGAITPVTHSLPTVAGNVISMIAGGNTIVFNAHPGGARIAAEGVRRFNKAIFEATGLENLITIVEQPTLETAAEIFSHRGVRILCVTGGPAVARAALESRKRAVVAGPGNPPVVVDESACADNAAKSIVTGAAYDNNLLCIGEKEVFAVEAIFSKLMDAVGRHGGHLLTSREVEQLTSLAFKPGKDHPMLNRDLIGKDATALAALIGVRVPASTQILYGETDESSPYVSEEQMMPFVPFVRVRDFRQGLELAKKHEHNFRHTAIIHSRNVRNMTIMGREMDTTLFIKNGPSMAGLGLGGEGYLSYSIATPTGAGVTSPLTFTRQRRCTLVDDLRVI
ncbi:MAG: aldehyde dehydrogenase EutE [Planctomycetia bacterium]|nr:aldehyde dehydrogenase EutE [Planctomycetia bacterium]